MAYRLNALFAWINRQNSIILIFILCLLNFFGIHPEGGEEQYFSFARQFMDPVWMPNSFTLNHPAGGNLAFQIITGFLLKYLTFEQMTVVGRTVNFFLYAIPLSLIFRKLKMSNIEVLFLLQVLFFSHQSLYAGEWIFKNYEEKSLAYVFVFWSLYYILDGKAVPASVSAAIATWFHFLVGGWMFGFVIFYFVFAHKKIWPVILAGLIYAGVTLPLVFYLYKTYLVNNPAVINGVNTNAIYAFWRLKHHIGIFHDLHYFFSRSFAGVMITLIMYMLCLFRFGKFRNTTIRSLNILNIIIFTQQFLFMFIAIFDRNGIVAKTYPFRTNSLSVFLFMIEVMLIIRVYLSHRVYIKAVQGFLSKKIYPVRKIIYANSLNAIWLLIALPVLAFEGRETIKNLNRNDDLDRPMIDLINHVQKNTPGYAVFLFADGDRPYSFIRRAERERFVVVKFTPTKSATIYEWYKRAILKERLRKDISLIDSIKNVYQVNYLVTDSVYYHPALIPEKQFGTHRLYRVE